MNFLLENLFHFLKYKLIILLKIKMGKYEDDCLCCSRIDVINNFLNLLILQSTESVNDNSNILSHFKHCLHSHRIVSLNKF